jgi:hypothetical protein
MFGRRFRVVTFVSLILTTVRFDAIPANDAVKLLTLKLTRLLVFFGPHGFEPQNSSGSSNGSLR